MQVQGKTFRTAIQSTKVNVAANNSHHTNMTYQEKNPSLFQGCQSVLRRSLCGHCGTAGGLGKIEQPVALPWIPIFGEIDEGLVVF
jgi:hypothetical protein